MEINFRSLKTDDPASVIGLRLVQRSGQPHLLISRGTQLFEAPVPAVNANGTVQFTGAGALGGLPSWDAKPLQGQKGAYGTLYVRAESAVAWAMFRSPDPPGDSRLHFEAFAVYEHPRFVKGQRPDQWSVTAVKYDNGASFPVVFPHGGLGPHDPPAVSVGKYARPVQDARLVRVDSGFWLFLLMKEPGENSAPKFRELPSGRQMPAVLSAVRLNASLERTSTLTRVFGATPIYEFDIDTTPDGRLVIVATTEQGIILAHDALEPNKPLPPESWQTVKLEELLVSPSALVSGGAVHVGAIANLRSPQAYVTYGAVPY